jgi:regulator of sigma E protease
MTLLIVVLVFGGMVFIHELGHFLAAKIVNIEVEEFGFGLPPKILTLFRWQGTDFTLNALPLGGFVRPKGENDPNVMDALSAANPWKRLFVLFAGPMMNLITAIFVTAIIVSQIGMADKKVLIDNVVADSPAAQVGLLPNDMILTINGQDVTDPSAARLLIKDGVDTKLTMIVERNGEKLSFAVTPLSTRPAELGALGVGLTSPRRSATFAETITSGVAYTGAQAVSILYMPIGLIQGVISPDEARLIGMKGIYDIFDQAVAKDTEGNQHQMARNHPTMYYLLLRCSVRPLPFLTFFQSPPSMAVVSYSPCPKSSSKKGFHISWKIMSMESLSYCSSL